MCNLKKKNIKKLKEASRAVVDKSRVEVSSLAREIDSSEKFAQVFQETVQPKLDLFKKKVNTSGYKEHVITKKRKQVNEPEEDLDSNNFLEDDLDAAIVTLDESLSLESVLGEGEVSKRLNEVNKRLQDMEYRYKKVECLLVKLVSLLKNRK